MQLEGNTNSFTLFTSLLSLSPQPSLCPDLARSLALLLCPVVRRARFLRSCGYLSGFVVVFFITGIHENAAQWTKTRLLKVQLYLLPSTGLNFISHMDAKLKLCSVGGGSGWWGRYASSLVFPVLIRLLPVGTSCFQTKAFTLQRLIGVWPI